MAALFPDQPLPTLLTSRAQLPGGSKGLSIFTPVEVEEECCETAKLPEAYPESVRVRNTFIDTAAQRSPSLDDFYSEREVSTCPSSHVGRLRNLFREEAVSVVPDGGTGAAATYEAAGEQSLIAMAAIIGHGNRACGQPSRVLNLAEALASPGCFGLEAGLAAVGVNAAGGQAAGTQGGGAWGATCPPGVPPYIQQLPCLPTPEPGDILPPGTQASYFSVEGVGNAPLHTAAGAPAAGVPPPGEPTSPPRALASPGFPQIPPYALASPELQRLEPCLPIMPELPAMPAPPAGPAPGSAELPSKGSSEHAAGRCKPCAFVHTTGCMNDLACQFCHLCEPGERKRRRREKLEFRRAERKSRAPARPAEQA